MAKLSFKKSENSTLSVPIIFIEKYMPKANGSFVKVYLYGLMCSTIPGIDVTNKDIAKALDILESDVYNAWKYWQEVGLIKTNESSGSFHVEFVDLSKPEVIAAQPQKKPTYHPKEIDIYITNNAEIRYLVNVAQEKLGKTLGPSGLSTIFSFYDWLKLPVAVIVMLLEYCAFMDKRSLAYIEKVAIDWADKGINTVDKVETHLKSLEKSTKNSPETKSVSTKNTKNKFLNFSQDKPDFDELMKLALENRIKDLKESRSS